MAWIIQSCFDEPNEENGFYKCVDVVHRYCQLFGDKRGIEFYVEHYDGVGKEPVCYEQNKRAYVSEVPKANTPYEDREYLQKARNEFRFDDHGRIGGQDR